MPTYPHPPLRPLRGEFDESRGSRRRRAEITSFGTKFRKIGPMSPPRLGPPAGPGPRRRPGAYPHPSRCVIPAKAGQA